MSDKIQEEKESFKTTWYRKYWAERESEEFNKWFSSYYGDPEDFIDSEDDDYHVDIEIEEYYKRKAFALMGWLGRNGEVE